MRETAVVSPAVDLLRELLSVPAPPGREEKMAALVVGKLQDLGLHPETDPAGNVLVRFPGQDPDAGSCVFAAHLDEIASLESEI